VTSLVKQGQAVGTVMRIADAAAAVNVVQRGLLAERLIDIFGSEGRKPADCVVALWGLAFKPDTDDVREAPAIVMAEKLLNAGFTVRAYDPQAAGTGSAELAMHTKFSTVSSPLVAVEGADALLIATEWSEFFAIAPSVVAKALRSPNVFDGRSVFSPEEARLAGLRYEAFGRAF